MTILTIGQGIELHAARAFFGMAWADQCEESEQASIISGREIMDVMPKEIDPAALHAARTLMIDSMRKNQCTTIEELYGYAKHKQRLHNDKGDRELTPELFGHYLAMQAMGTGVGLESFGRGVRDGITVPYVEFGGYSLEKDYFLASHIEGTDND